MIGVLIVTYNRLDLLKKTLYAYSNQNVQPLYIVVVNNYSNDGTKEFLNIWKKENSSFKKYVMHMPRNFGGSGGYYFGEKVVTKLPADWIWISDDDAYPVDKAFEKLSVIITSLQQKQVAMLCAVPIKGTGLRSRFRPHWIGEMSLPVPQDEYKNTSFSLDLAAYVGIIINKKYLCQAGLIKKEYFILFDDFEHSIRLGRCGKILCFPEIHFIHEVEIVPPQTLHWKIFYDKRNQMDAVKTLFPLKAVPFFLIQLAKILAIFFLRRHDIEELKFRLTALIDGWKGKLGQHPIYRPGWKPKQQ